MKTTSVHLRDGQDQAIEDIVRESVVREDVPDLSRSKVLRQLIDTGLEKDDLADLVSEPAIVKHRKETFTEREGWLRNQRTGYETQVKRHFKNRFENGFRPEQLEEWAENMRRLAFDLWPPDVGGDYQDRREEALAYVDAQLEAAKEAADASDFDPLDPQKTYSGYSGVENGRSRDRLEAVVEDASNRLQRGRDDEDALAVALAKEHGVSEDLAREAVDRALTESLDGEGGEDHV